MLCARPAVLLLTGEAEGLGLWSWLMPVKPQIQSGDDHTAAVELLVFTEGDVRL